MKMMFKQSQRSDKGYALLITIVFIGIALLLLGSMMDWTNSSAKQTERNNLFSMCSAAAEADTERVIAQMSRDFYNQTFNADSNYFIIYLAPSNQIGWPCQFSFSDGSNTVNQTGVSTVPRVYTTNFTRINAVNSAYSNLWATVANCTVTSTATTTNQPYAVSATVQQKFQLASIPLSQFAIFYNMDMEIDPGGTMNVIGRVFSNGGIWMAGSGLTFYSLVSAAGTATTNSTDPYCTGKSDSGQPTFNGGKPVSDADALAMPIGTNTSPSAVQSFLELPPTNITNPDSLDGQLYFYNVADLVISNSSGGVINTYFQDTTNVNRLTLIPCDVTNILASITTNGSGTHKTYTTNYSTNSLYSFATNTTFYDYRESKTVKAVQLNVGALKTWIESTNGSGYNSQAYADKGHTISSVYIYNNATPSSTNLPAARVANGAVLPTTTYGLTVATPSPLYVLGNYNLNNGDTTPGQTNTANTGPAAFIADSITVLSSKWKDTYNTSTNLSSRAPTNTTVNAAAFEGIVRSSGANYSGGVENFLRLLENWSSSTTLTYNGSIIVMFPSRYATNFWGGTYYGVPTRKWAFDVNFTQQNKIPPMMPQVKTLVPTGWSVY